MRKASFLIAALSLAISLPAMAQGYRGYGNEQDIGGHSRHMHRDWSQQEGRHVHNVCWNWDVGQGWGCGFAIDTRRIKTPRRYIHGRGVPVIRTYLP
jgi:hypothetical protein